MKVEIL